MNELNFREISNREHQRYLKDREDYPENEYTFTYKGIECKIRRHQDFKQWNGYLTSIPDEFDHESLQDQIDIHGEWTAFWGMDTLHMPLDYCPNSVFMASHYNEKTTFKSYEFVKEQLEQAIDQLIKIIPNEMKKLQNRIELYEKFLSQTISH